MCGLVSLALYRGISLQWFTLVDEGVMDCFLKLLVLVIDVGSRQNLEFL